MEEPLGPTRDMLGPEEQFGGSSVYQQNASGGPNETPSPWNDAITFIAVLIIVVVFVIIIMTLIIIRLERHRPDLRSLTSSNRTRSNSDARNHRDVTVRISNRAERSSSDLNDKSSGSRE